MLLSLFTLMLTTSSLIAQSNPAKSCDAVTAAGSHTGTSEISMDELKALNTINMSTACEDYKIISFEFTVVTKGGQPITLKGGNGTITKEMKNCFLKLGTGSKVFFDNVKAKAATGTTKNIPGLTLIVK